jgi:hypothetical protein
MWYRTGKLNSCAALRGVLLVLLYIIKIVKHWVAAASGQPSRGEDAVQ